MTDIEAKMASPASKKSRKSKAPTPIYRTSPLGGVVVMASDHSHTPSPASSPVSAFNPPTENGASSPIKKEGGVSGSLGGAGAPPFRSYSDFMRSLAAKYNNNDYFNPATNNLMDPLLERTLKAVGASPATSSAAAAAAAAAFNPFFALNHLATSNPASSYAPQLPPSTTTATLEATTKVPTSVPLDLSSSPPLSGEANEVLKWTVDDVVKFVQSIELCKEYAELFRDHNIDGSSLSLLTDDHLTSRLGMKLGPALKLRTALVRKMGGQGQGLLSPSGKGCAHCPHCQAYSASSTTPASAS